jgi:hypothetical protein
MINASARPELRPQLRAALARRLLELEGYENASLPARGSDAEAEEMLRKMMVQYRPGIAKKNLRTEDVSQLLVAAEAVASHVGWDDLRFVDSLNVLYESWEGDFRNEARLVFFGIYRRALQSLTSL